MSRNARRFFLDIDTEGEIAISAPQRTAFDDRNEFPSKRGMSAVGPAGDRSDRPSPSDDGFSSCIEFDGRLFFVSIKSVPIAKVNSGD